MMRRVLVAAACAALLSGCASGSDDRAIFQDPLPGAGASSGPAAGAPAGAADAWGDPAADTAGEPIGAAGTPCKLPVSFDMAESWKPQAVEAGLFDQGGFDLRCEIDAKPANHIGFLRVWSGPGKDPAKALETFVAAETPGDKMGERKTRATKAGTRPAAESTYINKETESRVRVLAVAAGKGIVILSLGGVDLDEHEGMLPAYVLAKQSLKIS